MASSFVTMVSTRSKAKGKGKEIVADVRDEENETAPSLNSGGDPDVASPVTGEKRPASPQTPQKVSKKARVVKSGQDLSDVETHDPSTPAGQAGRAGGPSKGFISPALSSKPASPRKASKSAASAKLPIPKKRTAAKAKGKSSGAEVADDETDSVPTTAPFSKLWEICADMLVKASDEGLNLYSDSGRVYTLKVGTLCSGTDAPVHALEMFGQLKNGQGNQVFSVQNCFACEIVPFKQGFLTRNSKPEKLFRDADDFTKEGATKA